jgi:hypothetical protein
VGAGGGLARLDLDWELVDAAGRCRIREALPSAANVPV